MKQKVFKIVFKGLSVARICLRLESTPFTERTNFTYRSDFYSRNICSIQNVWGERGEGADGHKFSCTIQYDNVKINESRYKECGGNPTLLNLLKNIEKR